MSKTIEDKAQDFAAINDDKAANSAHSYSKYDIADAYQQGAEFGYALAENRIKKEYEWKLRWIPVEEKLPDIYCCEIAVRKQKYKKTEIKIFLHSGQFKQFCKNHGYTEWRYFL